MEFVKVQEHVSILKSNKFVGETPHIDNSTITFKGENNIIYCDKNVRLKDSTIVFHGDNSVVYLSESVHEYKINVSMCHNSVMYFGKNNYINDKIMLVLSEEKNIFIGDDCMFSKDVWIRIADPHLIYSVSDHKRINHTKSVYIGDHVWVGQHAMILKGTNIGSGSIVGAMALVANKKIPSNVSVAGNPVRVISKDIFWTGACVHMYKEEATKKSENFNSDQYIYNKNDSEKVDFSTIEENFLNMEAAEIKLNYLRFELKNNKNRFFVDNK